MPNGRGAILALLCLLFFKSDQSFLCLDSREYWYMFIRRINFTMKLLITKGKSTLWDLTSDIKFKDFLLHHYCLQPIYIQRSVYYFFLCIFKLICTHHATEFTCTKYVPNFSIVEHSNGKKSLKFLTQLYILTCWFFCKLQGLEELFEQNQFHRLFLKNFTQI